MSSDLSLKPSHGLAAHPDAEEVAPARPDVASDGLRARLDRSRYAALRTFRASGEAVDTAVWFAREGDRVWFRTPRDSPKVRRLTAEPHVELRPCSWKGRPLGAPVHGEARVLAPAAATAAERRLAARYGWQWNVVPLLPVPGTRTNTHGTTWREKWRLARSEALWEGSVIVEVTLG